jgi:hypothetical protein
MATSVLFGQMKSIVEEHVRRRKQVSPFMSHFQSDHPPVYSLAVAASGGEINNSFNTNVSSISIISLYRYIVLIA